MKSLNKIKNSFEIKIALLGAFLLLSIPLCALWGSADISLADTVRFLVSKLIPSYRPELPSFMESIVWELRIPRILLGIAVGGGLSICGTAIQSLTRNMLSDPYILGVSSGASAMATFVMIFGGELVLFSAIGIPGAAFLGALLSLIAAYAISRSGRNTSSEKLLLAGVAVSMILNAATQFFVQAAPNANKIRSAMFWMMGSLGSARWNNVVIPVVASLAGLVVFMILSRNMNLMSLGDESAVTMGVNVKRMRHMLLVLISLVTGVIVASSGAIGFVGLMIPHIVRFIVGSDHKKVLPMSFLLGAVFLIWMDVGARLFMAPGEIPIGILTAFCGGPFFIWLLRRNKKR